MSYARTRQSETVFFPVHRVVDSRPDDLFDEELDKGQYCFLGHEGTRLWVTTVDGLGAAERRVGHGGVNGVSEGLRLIDCAWARRQVSCVVCLYRGEQME
jgi:hypothetical protein